AERTIDVGDGNCSAATERDLDLGRTFPTRREKRARLLARGLRIAIEFLGPELDEPRARKQPALVEPARDMRREMIGAVAHGILLADHIREQRSLRRGPFPAIYLPGCYINNRISPKRTLADEAYRPAAAAERLQGSVVLSPAPVQRAQHRGNFRPAARFRADRRFHLGQAGTRVRGALCPPDRRASRDRRELGHGRAQALAQGAQRGARR